VCTADVNYNASKGGPVVAFYSTPSHYVDAKFKATTAAHAKWEVRHDDIFPLGDAPHNYWSGYFTSRPSLKRQVRFASNFLNSARQMEVISGVTAEDVDHPTTRPSPPVGQSWTDSMEGAIGVATHHDGMSGTERQDVSDDYSQRISEGHFEVEAGVAKSLQKLAGITEEIGHCNCNAAGNCLNMSMCAYTTGADEFTVLAWNPTGQKATNWLRIPVSGAAYSVTDLSSNAVLPSQATLIDNRTHELPLLYINKFGMKAAQLTAEEAKLSNKATHVLTFEATTPPVGYSSFKVKKSAASEAVVTQPVATPSTVSNGVYELTINQAKGSIESVKNLASGVETTFNITWGYYVSSEGQATKTKLPNGTVETSGQASGAYMFRPDDQFTHACSVSQPTIEVTSGPLVTEIKQVFSSWATHIIRLTKGSPFIEVEWTAGPIPWNEGPKGKQGKELVVKFSSGLSSEGVYYTDSNGREMLKRKRDARGPSYPPFVINEPVAENYCAAHCTPLYPCSCLSSSCFSRTLCACAPTDRTLAQTRSTR
jgi:alpha-mannosidase